MVTVFVFYFEKYLGVSTSGYLHEYLYVDFFVNISKKILPSRSICDEYMSPSLSTFNGYLSPSLLSTYDGYLAPSLPICDGYLAPSLSICDGYLAPSLSICDGYLAPSLSICDGYLLFNSLTIHLRRIFNSLTIHLRRIFDSLTITIHLRRICFVLSSHRHPFIKLSAFPLQSVCSFTGLNAVSCRWCCQQLVSADDVAQHLASECPGPGSEGKFIDFIDVLVPAASWYATYLHQLNFSFRIHWRIARHDSQFLGICEVIC